MFKDSAKLEVRKEKASKSSSRCQAVQVIKRDKNRVALKGQSPLITDLLHEAFDIASQDMVLGPTAWPDEDSNLQHNYSKKTLLLACTSSVLAKHHSRDDLKELEECIETDAKYMQDLLTMVCNNNSLYAFTEWQLGARPCFQSLGSCQEYSFCWD